MALHTRFTTERTGRRLDPGHRGLPTDRNMSSPAAAATTTTDPGEGLASQHKPHMKPPSYVGDHATFEDWRYKFKAYMGVQHNFYTQFPPRAASSTTRLTEAELRGAAASQQEADDLKYTKRERGGLIPQQ